MNILVFTFNLFQEKCRVLWENPLKAFIVDPGMMDRREAEGFFEVLKEKGITPCAVLLTHGHSDHIGGVCEIQDRFAVPVHMAEDDAFLLKNNKFGIRTDWNSTFVKDGSVIEEGGLRFEVIATPGHTPGSVCYYERESGILLTGDTLFAGSIGRTDLEGGDYDKEIVSIMEKLIWLDAGVKILPGHGPDSTIAKERSTNPFLEPFNEKEEIQASELP